jgi:DNA-binding MarR family transcriptional regulator
VSLEDFAERLHSAAIHLVRRVATVDARAGLSPARHSALSVIVDQGPLTMTDLARTEGVSAATASSTVSGLEAAALVVRYKRGNDARSVVVKATDTGRRVLAEGRRARLALLEDGLASLSTEDREALARGVEVIERLTAGWRDSRSAPDPAGRLRRAPRRSPSAATDPAGPRTP